jgi:hypothetical protein
LKNKAFLIFKFLQLATRSSVTSLLPARRHFKGRRDDKDGSTQSWD